MRFSIPNSYADFFSTRKIIELEEVISEEQADILCSKTEELLLKALHQKPFALTSNVELWKVGKDFWKQDPEIKKILFQSSLGKIANNLFKVRPLRLAYMHTFFTEDKGDSPFPKDFSLKEISSATPILGGVCICLRSLEEKEERPLPSLLHQQKGSVIFFSQDYPIPFKELFAQKKARYLLLCLAPPKVRYALQPNDPLTHELKKEGYVFGDLFKEETCPYLFH